MMLLVAGLLAFACIHLTSTIPTVDKYWRSRFGHYHRAVFGLLLILSLAMIIFGWRLSPFVPVYDPLHWGRYMTFVIVLIAFFCLGIFLFRGSLRQRLRFPLAIAIILWAIGHLFANGDVASLVLFGGMMIYAALHIALGIANGIRPSAVVRAGHDALSILAGAALYSVTAQLHPILTGIRVLDLGSSNGTG